MLQDVLVHADYFCSTCTARAHRGHPALHTERLGQPQPSLLLGFQPPRERGRETVVPPGCTNSPWTTVVPPSGCHSPHLSGTLPPRCVPNPCPGSLEDLLEPLCPKGVCLQRCS